MTGGLLKLIEILQQAWDALKPYFAVKEWEGGVVLRYGRFHRVVEPGYYFKLPIFELAVIHTVVLQSARGPVQTIDKLSLRFSLKYRIEDVEKYVCVIADETNFLRDIVTANVAAQYLDSEDTWAKMMRRLRDEAEEGGFEIVKLRLVDNTTGRAFRHFMDQPDIE